MPHVNHRRETVKRARARTRYGRHYHPYVTSHKSEYRRLFRRHADWKLRDAIRDDELEDFSFSHYKNAVEDFWHWD